MVAITHISALNVSVSGNRGFHAEAISELNTQQPKRRVIKNYSRNS